MKRVDKFKSAGGKVQYNNAAASKYGNSFYTTWAWAQLRYETLKKYGCQCMLCGSTEKPMQVDHIKPRKKYPELALDPNNVQVLCKLCNMGKGDRDETDFRSPIELTN